MAQAAGSKAPVSRVSLTDEEEERLAQFYATTIISPSEYKAMSRDEQIIYEQLGEEAFLGRLHLTSTVMPSR